ncbi:DEAD/DEAH box helicase family protein [Desulfobacterium sp. N47]|uniref:DEAD/DEAH box helicase family protein n=1 Tax=Desulfobacterium sp. N47 TaxID=3115210 RepID=UPI003F4A1B4F
MLPEMATGTAKTLTIAMLMKRWLKAALISRVLFLVDRISSEARDYFSLTFSAYFLNLNNSRAQKQSQF